MNRMLKKSALALAMAGAASTAAALTLSAAFAGSSASYSQDIYKISVTSPAAGGQAITEWASLTTGTWRVEEEGQTFISSDDNYVVIDNATGSVYHRAGSPSFMGNLHAAPDGVLALRAYAKGDMALVARGLHLQVGSDNRGKTVLNVVDAARRPAFSATIEEHVTDQEAAAAHLLDTNPAQPDVTDIELGVGQAPADIQAYWFGPGIGTWHAAAAAEHARARTPAQTAAGMTSRGEVHAYIAFYERPGVPATSAEPGSGRPRPAGELQVSSEPLDSAHAQGLIDAFNGRNGDLTYSPWPRFTVTLADGEQATVVPDQFEGTEPTRSGFFVVTSSTLVSVSGEVALDEIPSLAAKLRPVG